MTFTHFLLLLFIIFLCVRLWSLESSVTPHLTLGAFSRILPSGPRPLIYTAQKGCESRQRQAALVSLAPVSEQTLNQFQCLMPARTNDNTWAQQFRWNLIQNCKLIMSAPFTVCQLNFFLQIGFKRKKKKKNNWFTWTKIDSIYYVDEKCSLILASHPLILDWFLDRTCSANHGMVGNWVPS